MLLDGNSLAFRAFYALPAENFKTRGGLTTNAVYGFTAMLINLLRDEAPTHIAAAFDVSRQTFRSERYPSTRPTDHRRPTNSTARSTSPRRSWARWASRCSPNRDSRPTTSSRRWPPRPRRRAIGSWSSPATATHCSWSVTT
ncbi:5'-3' exonuclease, N-terminal resolvase-like domain protein [Mycobacterium kansasii]|uniref:5'-3' exonuclease n=1 Tax=Mycobacterium kansasii TaxID=1768 RepID=A0A1V3WHG4_MYCKA|nr:5'-3' exonuclease, N-terminal resolvase-like domain protein [Mycobacterium kansasii]